MKKGLRGVSLGRITRAFSAPRTVTSGNARKAERKRAPPPTPRTRAQMGSPRRGAEAGRWAGWSGHIDVEGKGASLAEAALGAGLDVTRHLHQQEGTGAEVRAQGKAEVSGRAALALGGEEEAL